MTLTTFECNRDSIEVNRQAKYLRQPDPATDTHAEPTDLPGPLKVLGNEPVIIDICIVLAQHAILHLALMLQARSLSVRL